MMEHMTKESDNELWQLYINGILKLTPRHNIPKGKVITLENTSYVLDLHNHTVNAAYKKFNDFVDKHISLGTKQIMIITGKSGIIKNEFEIWCENLQIKKIILRPNGGSYFLKLR